jgi:hypothetical protein
MPETVDPNEWDHPIAAADEMIARAKRQRDALLGIGGARAIISARPLCPAPSPNGGPRRPQQRTAMPS